MRVEIYSPDGQPFSITSSSPRLIGDWFAETSKHLMSADSRMQDVRMQIWPQTREEMDFLKKAQGSSDVRMLWLNQDELLHLAQSILEISEAMANKSAGSLQPG